MKATSHRVIALRVNVIDPPVDVLFRMQEGKGDLIPPTAIMGGHQSFDLTVRLGEPRPDGSPNLLGPFAQGPATARFLYVNSGTYAGEAGSCWSRRAKVPLTGITASMIEEILASPDAILEARIKGTAKDGGPACATVPLIDEGWRVISR